MEWISIKEIYPEIYSYVLVLANNKGTNEPKPICIARLEPGFKWEFCNHMQEFPNYGAYMDIEYPIDSDDITHWMPLPKPPKD